MSDAALNDIAQAIANTVGIMTKQSHGCNCAGCMAYVLRRAWVAVMDGEDLDNVELEARSLVQLGLATRRSARQQAKFNEAMNECGLDGPANSVPC